MRTIPATKPGPTSGAVIVPVLLLAGLLLAGCSDESTEAVYSRTKDGVVAYFGVVPSQVVGTHPPVHPEAAMHGGVPADPQAEHVIVSLFARDDNARITDARVTATVRASHRTGRGETKPLEPFVVDGQLSYGNYFDFEMHRRYRIDVAVRRPGRDAPIEFTFHR